MHLLFIIRRLRSSLARNGDPRSRGTLRRTSSVAAFLIASAVGPCVHANEAYQAVLQMVTAGGEWERFDFARVALDAMVREHEAVLERSRPSGLADNADGTDPTDPSSKLQRRKLGRWRAAAMPYLDSLYAALDAVEDAQDIDVIVGGEGTVQLIVGPHNLVVSPIDFRNPGGLEADIAAEFCQLHECGYAVEQGLAPGRWEFGGSAGKAGFATTAGVRCLFDGTGSRGTKERACRQVGTALATVQVRLRRSLAAGIEVDAGAFEVRRDGPSTLSLQMNADGDWLMVDDATLAPLRGVLELALPWLGAGLTGDRKELVIPRADLLLAPLLKR